MRTVGQSPWDDIKILGQRLGHLISNSEPGGTAPSLIFSSFRCSMLVQWLFSRSAYSEHYLNGVLALLRSMLTVCKHWPFILICGWDRVGTLISKFAGKMWDIDIKEITVSHCHHIAWIWHAHWGTIEDKPNRTRCKGGGAWICISAPDPDKRALKI